MAFSLGKVTICHLIERNWSLGILFLGFSKAALADGAHGEGDEATSSLWKSQGSVFCLLAEPVVEIEKELFFNVLIDVNLHRADLDIEGFAVALHHESHLFSGGL